MRWTRELVAVPRRDKGKYVAMLLKAVADTKREKTISLGGRSHRISNDHHSLLSELHEQFIYISMEDLLFFTSLIGVRLALSMPLVSLFAGDKR